VSADTSREGNSRSARPGRRTAAGGTWTRAGSLAIVAAAVSLLLGPGLVAAQDSAAAGPTGPDHDVLRVLMRKEFAGKLDSIPGSLTWDDLRSGIATEYDATAATVKKGDKAQLVFYSALVKDGDVAVEHTSDSFEVIPGGSKVQPDRFFGDDSMLPDGWTLKGTFLLGEVTVPSDKPMSETIRGVLGDLSGGSPLLFMEAIPADGAARSGVKVAPLILTFQKGSPSGQGG